MIDSSATRSSTVLDREVLVPVEWPAALRDALTRSRRFRRSPLISEVPALVIPVRPPLAGMPPEQRPFPRPMPGEPRPPFPGPPGRFGGQPPPPRYILIVEIDREYLTRDLFPSLAKQHFQVDARELDVAITDGEKIVYRSDASWPESVTKSADVQSRLLEIRGVPPGQGPDSPPPIAGEGAGAPTGSWRLTARRHAGSLEQLVASARRRYLAISFGMLVILAGSGVILAMLLRRAERLRLQQLEFVAGVTHELNTPLAALGSAGQNLADGIITADDQVKRYGQMIVRESSRLADMVSQVLEFAGMRSGRAPLGREPVSASAVVEQAVENCASFAVNRPRYRRRPPGCDTIGPPWPVPRGPRPTA
jgi:His Kinase A (phospho-acceptor) domain